MKRSKDSVSRLFLVAVAVLLALVSPWFANTISALPTSHKGEHAGNQQQERQLNKKRRRWRTLKFLVDGAYFSYRRISSAVTQQITPSITPPSYVTGDMLIGVFNRGTSLGNNNIYYETDKGTPIGISYQTCVTAMQPPINSFMCTWVLGLTGSADNIGQVNQIMAQGAFYNDSIRSDNILTIPTYQFVAITGGTGDFRSIAGFIVISPRSLLDSPPTWWYYIVYRFQ